MRLIKIFLAIFLFNMIAIKPIKDVLSDHHYVHLLCLDCTIYSMEIQKSNQIIKRNARFC